MYKCYYTRVCIPVMNLISKTSSQGRIEKEKYWFKFVVFENEGFKVIRISYRKLTFFFNIPPLLIGLSPMTNSLQIFDVKLLILEIISIKVVNQDFSDSISTKSYKCIILTLIRHIIKL